MPRYAPAPQMSRRYDAPTPPNRGRIAAWIALGVAIGVATLLLFSPVFILPTIVDALFLLAGLALLAVAITFIAKMFNSPRPPAGGFAPERPRGTDDRYDDTNTDTSTLAAAGVGLVVGGLLGSLASRTARPPLYPMPHQAGFGLFPRVVVEPPRHFGGGHSSFHGHGGR